MPDAYMDARGNLEPQHSPGHVYLGSLRRGRVCRIVGSGERLKVVSQNEGSTTVRVSRPGRTFQANGKVVKIRSSTALTTLARSTVVQSDG